MNHKEPDNIDYGFRFLGKPVLFYEDRSLAADESTHQMEKALRLMSLEYYALDRCFQCGICSSHCPYASLGDAVSFSPRTFIQKTRLGLLSLAEEELWMCTNCGQCEIVCPHEIPILEVMASLRHLVVEQGAGYIPVSIKKSLSSINSFGNPWREKPEKRSAWFDGLVIDSSFHSENGTVYIFLGCFSGYDPRARKTVETVVRILHHAGFFVKVLTDEEVCCGDTVRRVGDFATSQKMERINTQTIRDNNISEMFFLSPHCFSAFKRTLGKDEVNAVRIAPLLELIHLLVVEGIIRLNNQVDKRITFHDPCFFSKHIDVIKQPREIIGKIPGVDLVEMEHHGGKSLCCGGGGGGIWRDTKKGQRLSEIRLDEVLLAEVDTVVTSCPYCISMLDDARKGNEKYSMIEVLDITELIWMGMDI